MLNLSQENKSDLGEGCGGKTGRRKGTESPPGRKNHRSSLLQRCPNAKWLQAQQPCRMWGFPSLGALSARRCPRHSRREGGKAEPPGSCCCCPDAPGCRVEGRDKQNLNGLLGQGSEQNQLLLVGGEGQGGHLGDSQNKATAPMK